MGQNFRGLSQEVEAIFVAYPWPGNIRELENTIEFAAAMETGNFLTLNSLPSNFQALYAAEKAMREFGDKVPAEIKSEVESGIADVKKAAEGDDVARIRSETEALGQVIEGFGIDHRRFSSNRDC